MPDDPNVISLLGPYALFEGTCRARNLKPVLGLGLRTSDVGEHEVHVVLLDGAIKRADTLSLFRRLVVLLERGEAAVTEEGGSNG